MNPRVSVLIPTYNRSRLLNENLKALESQTYKNFEVVVIVGYPRPSGDRTEALAREYQQNGSLRIKLIFEKKGVIRQLNSGIKFAEGEIIALLDDDAIADKDWIRNHLDVYSDSHVGGVAGNVIPAKMTNGKPAVLDAESSEVIPYSKKFLKDISGKIWDCPVRGLENYLVYISKAGKVIYNVDLSGQARLQKVDSLLGMGTNMSILAEAVGDFEFPRSWVYPIVWEQFIAYHIWKKGYKLFFNPCATVYHILHGATLSRNLGDRKSIILSQVESQLLFYRLLLKDPSFSWMNRITSNVFDLAIKLKKIREDTRNISLIEGMILGELMGLRGFFSKNLE